METVGHTLWIILVVIGQCSAQISNTRGCRADVCFVMDESGSISRQEWEQSEIFVLNFVEQLTISAVATQVGIVRFSSSAYLEFPLNRHPTKSQLKTAISNMVKRSGGTNIGRGIDTARIDCFNATNGDRSDAIDILVLLTDGKSNSAIAIAAADTAKAEGIHLVSIGVGRGIDQTLLIQLAGGADNFFTFMNFDQLIADVTLILGQSCLVADDCAGGQLTDIAADTSFPAISDCPTLSNPYLKDEFLIEFLCNIHYNETSPDARYDVTFLFDGQRDTGVSTRTLTPPANEYILEDQHLHGRLNKYISCEVKSYFASTSSVVSPGIVSRSYWAGVAPSRTSAILWEGDDRPRDFHVFSSLPIPCNEANNVGGRPCLVKMRISATNPDSGKSEVAIYQPLSNAQDLEDTKCTYVLRQRDWKDNETIAYNLAAPLRMFAQRDSIISVPRRLNVAIQVLPLDSNRPSGHTHPMKDLLSDEISLLIFDEETGTCVSRGDPWVKTLDGLSYPAMQQGCFNYVKSNSSRKFLIQARHFPCWSGDSPGCSLACAVGVQEGDEIVVIDRCNEQGTVHVLTMTLPGTSSAITISNNPTFSQYTIETAGGAVITVNKIFRGVNLNIKLPPRDKGKTMGLCGTYDDDSTNDKMKQDGTEASSNNEFIEDWRCNLDLSLFRGVAGNFDNIGNEFVVETENLCNCDANSQAGAVACGIEALQDNIPVPFSQPIKPRIPFFLWQNIVQSGRKKRQISSSGTGQRTDNINYAYETQLDKYNDTTQGDENRRSWVDSTRTIKEAEARSACTKVLDDIAVSQRGCANIVSSADRQIIIEDCVADVQIMDTLELVASREVEYTQLCCDVTLKQNLTSREPDKVAELLNEVMSIANAVCIGGCGDHGKCNAGACQCNTGYVGPDCSTRAGSPPEAVSYQEPKFCDTQQRLCEEATVTANNILLGANVACRVAIETFAGSKETVDSTAQLLDPSTVVCRLKGLQNLTESSGTDKSRMGYSYKVQLSNDEVAYSAPTDEVRWVIDSKCVVCDYQGKCSPRTDTCLIKGLCYDESAVVDNCYKCDPTKESIDQMFIPGVGRGIDQTLLIQLAGGADNFFTFMNFDQLIADVTLILGQSCLVADDCACGQLTDKASDMRFPAISDCPTLSNPYLKDEFLIEFLCTIHYNETSPDARYDVTFLFDGQRDAGVPTRTLTPPVDEYILEDQHLHGRLNKYISCEVKSYFASTSSVVSPGIVSRSYWAGVAPSRTSAILWEGDDRPRDFHVFSSLPIPCNEANNVGGRPCLVKMRISATNPDSGKSKVAIYQPLSNAQDLEDTKCTYVLRQRDWKDNETIAYNLAAPLRMFAQRDSIISVPRRLNVAIQVLPLDSNRPSGHTHPMKDLLSDEISLLIFDEETGTCLSRGDPWVKTLDGLSYPAMQQGCFNYVKSNSSRKFLIQARHFPCWPGGGAGCSLACAVGVQEGDEIVVVDRCNEQGTVHVLTMTLPGTSSAITISNNPTFSQYTIETAGGAVITVNKIFRGVNLNIKLPPRDKGRTMGLCGTYDDDSTNDKMKQDGTEASSNNEFIEDWRCNLDLSLFRGVAGNFDNIGNEFVVETENLCNCDANSQAGAVACGIEALQDNIPVPFSQPIKPRIPFFLWQNIVQSGRKKRQISSSGTGQRTDNINYAYETQLDKYNDTTQGDENRRSWADSTRTIKEAEARSACTKVLDDIAVSQRGCANIVSSADRQIIIEDCVADVQIMDTLELVASREVEYTQLCCDVTLKQNLTSREPDKVAELLNEVMGIANAVCIGGCGDHGKCNAGACQCNTGYVGPDCSTRAGSPPEAVSYQEPKFCDTQQRLCEEATVTANNILLGANVACRVAIETFAGSKETVDSTAQLLDPSTVVCRLKGLQNLTESSGTDKSRMGYSYKVQLSNDEVAYSEPTDEVRWVIDSKCAMCDDQGKCSPRTDTCLIKGLCYEESDVVDDCYKCDPNKESIDQMFIPGTTPTFTSPKIFKKTASDSISIQLAASNPSGDELVYSLKSVHRAVTVTSNGLLQWGSETSPKASTTVMVRVQSVSTCPRFIDVELTLQTISCDEICGAFSVCNSNENSKKGLGQYTCQCIVNTKCGTGTCQNGGSCMDKECSFFCSCPADYSGPRCETFQPVGTWGDWSAFGKCSKPCDYGLTTRARTCLRDPCEGDTEEEVLCNKLNCPENKDEVDEGATISFKNLNIQEISKKQGLVKTEVASLLNNYCQTHVKECCTSVFLETLEKPIVPKELFVDDNVGVASGFPRRDDGNVLLKLLVQVDIARMNLMCDLVTPTPPATQSRRRKRQTSNLRPVSSAMLEDAMEDGVAQLSGTLGAEVTVVTEDKFRRSVVIPAVAASSVLGFMILVASLFFIVRKCKRMWKERNEKLRLEEEFYSYQNPYGRVEKKKKSKRSKKSRSARPAVRLDDRDCGWYNDSYGSWPGYNPYNTEPYWHDPYQN